MKKNCSVLIALAAYILFQCKAASAMPNENLSQKVITPSEVINKPVIINKFLQFILPAASGTITNDVNGTYKCQLNGVATDVAYFTNRPRRITGSMTTAFFLKRWIKPPPHDFISNPPNAVITYIDNAARQQFFIVELMQPLYDAKTNTLNFIVKPLPGSAPLPVKLVKPTVIMSEVTICGLIGSWGNLPGEKQYDIQCHAKARD